MATKTRKASKKVDYVIAIPSYKRAETLRDKTLRVLADYKIDPKKIDVFVADKDEEAIYRDILPKGTYGRLIVGVPKLGPQRNFMGKFYPLGKAIVYMDDDITGFIEFEKAVRRHEKPLVSLEKIIQRGFAECRKHSCHLWGIYPTPNGFFMANKVDSDLRYIIGCFYGMLNPRIPLELEGDKEDYERSVRSYIADGAVIRMRFVAPKTAYYTEKGGLQEFRTKKTILDGAEWMVKHFPEYCTLNLTKKSGHPELRLKDRSKETS